MTACYDQLLLQPAAEDRLQAPGMAQPVGTGPATDWGRTMWSGSTLATARRRGQDLKLPRQNHVLILAHGYFKTSASAAGLH